MDDYLECIVKFQYDIEVGYREELVRCKNCINCVKEPNGELYCDILAVEYEPFGSKKVNSNWYCADGKRRDNDA